MKNLCMWVCGGLLSIVVTCSAWADDDDVVPPEPKIEQPVNTTDLPPLNPHFHALVICGHPGDDEHREMYAESVDRIVFGLNEWLRFPTENIRVQFGSDPKEDDLEPVKKAHGKGTLKELVAEAERLRKTLTKDDTLWVIVMGHAHFDNRHSWLNIVGDDIHEVDFAEMFKGIPCSEQVFFMTTPASGFFIKPLAAPHRVVIAATQVDREVNETIYHRSLASILSEPDFLDLDFDKDSKITLFDFYIAIAQQVAQDYVDDELLATEHSLLDDNADGVGSESQMYFLTEELGGRKGLLIPKRKTKVDGSRARTIMLKGLQ